VNPFINRSGRLRAGWWIALFFIVLTALLLPLILMVGQGGSVPIWQQALVVIVASLICQGLRRQPIGELTGAFDLRWPLQLGLGVLIGAALMLIPALILWALGAVAWRANHDALAALPTALALFAAVAVTEEVLFRGFLFQRLIDGLGVWPAQLLVAALFVLTHSAALEDAGALGYLAGANIFIASLMFGFAFVATRSLAMPIGIHFAANFVQGYVLGFGVSGDQQQGFFSPLLKGPDWLTGGAFGLEASAPGFVIVSIAAVALWLWRRVQPVGAGALSS
jgi:membrane protease YdiL (CAAX protease family)